MPLELSRKHLTEAFEQVDVWGYKILSSPHADTPGVAVTLPPAKATEFIAALTQILIGEGRRDDADELTYQALTTPRGRAVATTWPGATLTD
jgi:hypothetical protein